MPQYDNFLKQNL